MVTITHRNNVPPGGGWIYIQPESGLAFKHPDLNRVKEMVRKHRLANNYPVGIDFDREIENYICQTRPELCGDTTPPSELTFFQRVGRFASASIRWAASGFKVVTAEQYAQRFGKCAGTETSSACEFWRGESTLFEVSCAVCGCGSKKLWMASEECPKQKWSKTI